MRSQSLYTDPLCSCSAIKAKCNPDYSGRLMIASRQDLSPKNGTYPFSNLKHSNHGALDCKITNKKYIEAMKMRAISSPPYEVMPAFDWSTIQDFKVSHIGLPDKWEFPWVDI